MKKELVFQKKVFQDLYSFKMKLMILSIGENSIANYALIEYFKTHNDDIVFGYDKVLLISTKSRTNEISKRIMDLQKDISFETIELEKDEEVNFNKIKDYNRFREDRY